MRTIGWRWTFYLSTAINAAITAGAAFALPARLDNHSLKFKDFYDPDWVGCAIASGALGAFSYVVA
jgi:predicted MFS family arabinose efflux permease